MLEKLLPLKIPPGLYRNGTEYQTAGRWSDAQFIRFIDGTIRPIGGWRRATDSVGAVIAPLTGRPRGAFVWRANDSVVHLALGTHATVYALAAGTLTDISPAGWTPGRETASAAGGNGNYGDGEYGAGPYGSGGVSVDILPADTWQFDNFGGDLVACFTGDGRILQWDTNEANDLTEVSGGPQQCRGVVVTPERFLVALGADGDPRKIAWASQETTDDWVASSSNTAGDYILATQGQLVAGRRTRRQTLLFTDKDMHTLTYIGGAFLYAVDQAGDNCGLIAQNAVAVVDTQALWMGHDNFFIFDGFAKPIACEVRDYVFGDINRSQQSKFFAVSLSEFGEVWWFYCSAGATEPDRYVVYNYRENHWTTGQLSRSAGVDRGVVVNPIWLAPTGEIYEQEVLQNRDGPAPFLEGGPLELGDGDNVMRIQRVVPDERTLGDMTVTLFVKFFPTGPEAQSGPHSAANPTDVRVTGRQVRVRVDEARELDWRFGTLRLGVRAQGRR